MVSCSAGLPNFDLLDRININIDLPEVNLQLDSSVIRQVTELDWSCEFEVKNVCSADDIADLSPQCTADL